MVPDSHGALREAQEEVPGFRAAVELWMASGDFSNVPERVKLPAMNWAVPEIH